MATYTTPRGTIQPIYTTGDLHKIEAELGRADLFIEYRGRGGSYFKKLNPLPRQGLVEAPPHSQVTRNVIDYKGERELDVAISRGREQWFTPMMVVTRPFRGPNLSSNEVIMNMETEIASWESTRMCESLFKTLQNVLPTNINKIIGFGLGSIGDQGNKVAVYLQDPAYTSVCKGVLSGTYGFRIINGFGARGFTMVDENTIVMSHHPNYPLREIIADIARPAAVCWTPSNREGFAKQPPRGKILSSDVDSVRIDEMLKEYQETPIPGFRSKNPVPSHDDFQISWMEEPFYDSVWYIRKPKL
ncbi:hypothetical protein F4814DRAFT_420304 [Daldinia grandis]|nr:hypothetical protein F4814DRAFT_420304 [Daldinia grandis]